MNQPLKLSIVTTVYRSAAHVEDFYRRVCACAESITPDFEIVVVDDGSPDDSLERILDIRRRDSRVRVVSLSRNFGHHKALMTGLSFAKGELVFLIDSDLEIDPEVLPTFMAQLSARGGDVVYGVRDVRLDRPVDRYAGRLFYTVFNWLSPHSLPVNLTTTRLMTRRFVTALLRHQEREMIIAGLWAITGFEQSACVVRKSSGRKSTYSLAHKMAVLTNAVTSFSDRPLVIIFYGGCAISVIAGAVAVNLVARRLLFGTIAQGWLSLVVAMWLLGGITILCLGVIGIYLSKIFIETKQRPYTIVKELYGVDEGERRG